MADFCLECTFNIFPELLPTGENDLAGLCEPDEKVWTVCEGCGPGWFDFTGQRVTGSKVPTVASGNIQSGEPSPGTVLANPTEAEFCLECIGDVVPELVGTGLNDLARLCEPGQGTWAVCEGCGAGWFDAWGRRVASDLAGTSPRAVIKARMSEALTAVQAAQTVMHQLCQASDLAMWANGLNELYLLKHNLDTELALAEDAPMPA